MGEKADAIGVRDLFRLFSGLILLLKCFDILLSVFLVSRNLYKNAFIAFSENAYWCCNVGNHFLATLVIFAFMLSPILQIPIVMAYQYSYSGVWAKQPTAAVTFSSNILDGSSFRRIVADNAGNLYIGYWNGTTVLIAKSKDGGTTWNASWGCPRPVSFLVNGSANIPATPSICIDSKNNLHVVYNIWEADKKNYAMYRMWNATTQTWGLEITLSSSPISVSSNMVTCPQIFVDSQDIVHTVWSVDGYPQDRRQALFYSRWNGSWTNPSMITYDWVCRFASMAVDSTGRVFVAFLKVDPVPPHTNYLTQCLQLAFSNDSSWQQETIFQTNGPANGTSINFDPILSIDSNNYVHVVFTLINGGNLNLYYIRQTLTGWTQPINLQAGYHPTIYADSQTIVVASQKFPQIQLCISKDSGATWSNQEQITTKGITVSLAYSGRWIGQEKILDLVWVEDQYVSATNSTLQSIFYAALDVTPTATVSPTPNPTPIFMPPATMLPFPSSSLIPFPTLSPSLLQKSPSSIKATTDSGADVDLTLSGNITSSQMSNVTLVTDHSSTTILSFALTGQSGSVGFSKVVIPKNAVLYGVIPTIYIDNQLAQDQGYTSDFSNYCVWYTTHFSIHNISIVFAVHTIQPATQINAVEPTTYQKGTRSPEPATSLESQLPTPDLLVFSAVVAAVVLVPLVGLFVRNTLSDRSFKEEDFG